MDKIKVGTIQLDADQNEVLDALVDSDSMLLGYIATSCVGFSGSCSVGCKDSCKPGHKDDVCMEGCKDGCKSGCLETRKDLNNKS